MRPLSENELCEISGMGISYGGQADGFQPNVSAGDNGMGLFKDDLSNNIAGGMIAGSPGGVWGMALGAFGGMVAGGAFNGIGSSTGSSSSSA